MARFCNICGGENATLQLVACDPGSVVMYLISDLYVFGFATVVDKHVVEYATLINGEQQGEPEIDVTRSYIKVVPYGCKASNKQADFNLHVGEFMLFNPDDEGIEDQMGYTRDRCCC